MKTLACLIFLLLLGLNPGLKAFAKPTPGDKAQAAALNHSGVAAFAADRYTKATPLFQKAATVDPSVEAYVLNLAISLQWEGRYAEGASLLDTRISDFPSPDDQKELRIELADLQFIWGDFLLARREQEQALPHFQAALTIDRTLRAEHTVYDLDKIAFAYDALSRFETAISFYERALAVLRDFENPVIKAGTLNADGLAHDHLSRYAEAITLFEQARTLLHDLKDSGAKATTLSNLGTVYDETGRYSEALECYKQAATIQHQSTGHGAEGHGAEARTLNNVGRLYEHLGRTEQALDFYMQALPLWRQAKDHLGEAITLGNIGEVNSHLGRYQRAITFYKMSLPILRQYKDQLGEAETVNNLAAAWLNLQRYDQAIALFSQALKIEEKIGARNLQASTLSNLGSVYNELAQYPRAIEYFNQALRLWQAVASPAGQASAYSNLGEAYDSLSQYDQSILFYKKALLIERSIGDRLGEATTLNNIGMIYYAASENYDRAIAFLSQSLLLRQQSEDRAGEAAALNNLAACYDSLHDFRRALDLYQQALIIRREVKDRVGEAATLNNLMFLWKDQRKFTLAIFYGKIAVNNYQSVRGDVQSLGKETQKTYIASLAGSYRALADLLIQAGRFDEAQQVLGMLKEEEFFDFLGRDPSAARILTASVSLTPSETTWAANYRNAVSTPAMTVFFSGMTTATASPGTAPPARKTAPGTAAIYTIVEPDRLLLVVMTSTGPVARAVTIKSDILYRKVLALRNAFQDPTRDPRPLSAELYKIIVGPLEADLKDAHAATLLWSLDDALRYLPVAALYDGKEYLVERYNLAVLTLAAPAASVPAAPAVPWTGLGLGVSLGHPGFEALPGVRDELAGIIGPVVPGISLLDGQFTQASFLAGLKRRNHPLVHIASHFSLSGRDTDSFLLLGDGGHLSLAQIKADPNIFAGVDLLTLSACNTAMEVRSAGGKEVEGFGALAQRLGARSVLASLWPVADASTPILMREFYRLRASSPGLSKAEALRQAQLSLLHGDDVLPAPTIPGAAPRPSAVRGIERRGDIPDPDLPAYVPDPKAPYAHPYYWAPFVLIGNPQ